MSGSEYEPSIEAQSSLDLEREMVQADLAEARAEIARLEGRIREIEFDWAVALSEAVEDKTRALKEAGEELARLIPGGSAEDNALHAWRSASGALDTQAREGPAPDYNVPAPPAEIARLRVALERLLVFVPQSESHDTGCPMNPMHDRYPMPYELPQLHRRCDCHIEAVKQADAALDTQAREGHGSAD